LERLRDEQLKRRDLCCQMPANRKWSIEIDAAGSDFQRMAKPAASLPPSSMLLALIRFKFSRLGC
jgi:hypothetical protein